LTKYFLYYEAFLPFFGRQKGFQVPGMGFRAGKQPFEETSRWKVSCKFSYDSCLWSDVYLNGQGVTQLMITRITEPEY